MRNFKLKSRLFLFVVLTHGLNLWAQEGSTNPNANVTNETNTNKILTDYATQSQKNIKDTGFKKIFSNGNAGGETQRNLTDQEKQLSENYVHQGLANRIIEQKCAGEEMQQMCNGQDPHSSKTMLINSVAKAYAMFGAMGGDDFLGLEKPAKTEGTETASSDKASDTGKDAAGKDAGKKGEQKNEKASDYCKYIPAATETIATFQQQMTTKTLSQGTPAGETAQKDTIMRAAKNHDERAKGAQIQSVGWFAGGACYGYLATAGGYAINTGMVVKLGAAVFLGAFYQNEVKTNKEYADKTRAVANSLPGKGDCNPVTQKGCYCSQPETENDPNYCMEELHKKAIASNSIRVACIDSTLKADPQCNCERSNSCFEKMLSMNDMNNLLGFGSGAGSPYAAVRSLTHGELQGGVLSGSSYNQSMAIAKKALLEASRKYKNADDNLSAQEKALARDYQSAGIPANIAAVMAKTNIPKSNLDSAMAKLSGANGKLNIASDYSKGSSIINFSGGEGLGIKGKTQNAKEDLLSKFNFAKKDGQNNSKVVEFAVQKAQSQNQISRSDSSIFEIISNRYLNSGRRLLKIDGQ